MHICKVQVFPGLVAQKKFKFKTNNNNKKNLVEDNLPARNERAEIAEKT